MSRVAVSREKLVAVADAVRAKTGGTESLTLDEMPRAIARISGDGGSVTFPHNGYSMVNYIEFTGEQYVDTGLYCTQDTRIFVMFTRADSEAITYLFGTVNDANTASVTAYLSSSGNWRFGNKYINRKNLAADNKAIHVALIDKNGIMSSEGLGSFGGVTNFTTLYPLLLGSCNMGDGTVSPLNLKGRVLTFEIWEKGKLVLKYIPVKNSEGIYGFWDTVSKTFRTSATDVALAGGML